MLEFKKFKISDREKINQKTNVSGVFSCETSFVNLFVWQNIYKNMYAQKDGFLFIKSGENDDESFRLPFGNDFKTGMKMLCEYCKGYPTLWIQQGERYNAIAKELSEDYIVTEHRDAFDYIYLQSDLANLRGKKYHSKRNHISAFSKQYKWQFEEITNENAKDVLNCAEEWYKENFNRYDKYMQCEYEGIKTILQNLNTLAVRGGAIYVDGKVVAFTLGSPINNEVFDIHIEKALSKYATAYTLINNEFAKTLSEYKYINREDDLGLEGLRKAKLSYKPEILLKKYLCVPKIKICKEIYHSCFNEESDFEDKLFKNCFKYCEYLQKGGEIVSICFAFPCKIGKKEALYIFGVATDEKFRNQGYATELLEKIKSENEALLILRPQNDGLVSFYEKLGFKKFVATNIQNDFTLIPSQDFLNLATEYKETNGEFTAMSFGKEDLNNLYFPYSMP